MHGSAEGYIEACRWKHKIPVCGFLADIPANKGAVLEFEKSLMEAAKKREYLLLRLDRGCVLTQAVLHLQ